MVNIQRVRVAFTGLRGLPGVSTFYATAGADMISPLRDFYAALNGNFPIGMTTVVENFGDIIEDSTGALTGTWSGAVSAAVVSTTSQTYAAPVGACVNWLTGQVIGGRRLRGRTFIVPLVSGTYQGDGTLTPEFLGELNTARANFTNAVGTTFLVWGRPRLAVPATPTHKAVTARLGASALVTSSLVKDRCAVLRSRRD